MNFLKYFLSFLYPVTIEKTSSIYNPLLEVKIENGKYVLNAANANYSFGSLHQIFLNAFKQTKTGEREIKNVLLLGLGGGSVPVILFEEFKLDCKITAVEIDEAVIELSKEFFNMQRFQMLEIICADAFEFVQKCSLKFDLIIVDIFIDNKVPSQFESDEFLFAIKGLMNRKGIIMFNKIIGLENEATPFNLLLKCFENNFTEIKVLNIYNNIVFIAESKNQQELKSE